MSNSKAGEEIEAAFQDGTADPVLVGFGAKWCGPWRLLNPVLKEIEEKGSRVIRVDVDEHPELADQYVVVSVPTFFIISEARETRRWLGAVSQSELEAGLITKKAVKSGMRRRR